ncbi:MerR family transcriptional regulator [Kineococcus sp. T13]|uniref:MerR family transcriptional regulator n=1 Tax=Kineococcus vitellinus TaxID=2696565 RepID=UPI001413547A|nr:MerR family transcriptional regulator [Kineococcus vitellinus]
MKVSEVAQRAGVPLSAVKYYQREGLLPAGARSAPNQVAYGEEHVRRVRLVRALLETGGLSVAATKDVIAALDAEAAPLARTFQVAQHAMGARRVQESAPSGAARARVEALAAARGWCVTSDNPGFEAAARALDGLRSIGFDPPQEYLDAYAAAAGTAAAADLQALSGRGERDAVAELMVVGTVLGDPLFAGLRRLAQQDATRDAFPAPARGGRR